MSENADTAQAGGDVLITGQEPRTVPLSVRIPPHLRARIDDYAERYGMSVTDATVLALYRAFGDHRGQWVLDRFNRRKANRERSYAAPRRAQQPARSDPLDPLPDPFEDDDA
jgi:hypothetical protein